MLSAHPCVQSPDLSGQEDPEEKTFLSDLYFPSQRIRRSSQIKAGFCSNSKIDQTAGVDVASCHCLKAQAAKSSPSSSSSASFGVWMANSI